MRRYVAGRLLLMIPTLVGVAILTFVIMRAVPGAAVGHRRGAPPARSGQTHVGAVHRLDGRDREVRSRHLALDRAFGRRRDRGPLPALSRAGDHRDATGRRDRDTAGSPRGRPTGHLG